MDIIIKKLREDEILLNIFKCENMYYTRENIINQLVECEVFDNQIKKCLEILDNNPLFINIDLFYEQNCNRKNFKKLPYGEMVRYLVRNTEKDSQYGNFHNVEYKYINGVIINELKKLKLSTKIIDNCNEYLNLYPEKKYSSDRYIMNQNYSRYNNKFIYKSILYKFRNIYVVYNQENMYYCTRSLTHRRGQIEFLGKKYYQDIDYSYYDIQTQDMVCDSKTLEYFIVNLIDICNYLDIDYPNIMSFKQIDSIIKNDAMKIKQKM